MKRISYMILLLLNFSTFKAHEILMSSVAGGKYNFNVWYDEPTPLDLNFDDDGWVNLDYLFDRELDVSHMIYFNSESHASFAYKKQNGKIFNDIQALHDSPSVCELDISKMICYNKASVEFISHNFNFNKKSGIAIYEKRKLVQLLLLSEEIEKAFSSYKKSTIHKQFEKQYQDIYLLTARMFLLQQQKEEYKRLPFDQAEYQRNKTDLKFYGKKLSNFKANRKLTGCIHSFAIKNNFILPTQEYVITNNLFNDNKEIIKRAQDICKNLIEPKSCGKKDGVPNIKMYGTPKELKDKILKLVDAYIEVLADQLTKTEAEMDKIISDKATSAKAINDFVHQTKDLTNKSKNSNDTYTSDTIALFVDLYELQVTLKPESTVSYDVICQTTDEIKDLFTYALCIYFNFKNEKHYSIKLPIDKLQVLEYTKNKYMVIHNDLKDKVQASVSDITPTTQTDETQANFDERNLNDKTLSIKVKKIVMI